jgi:molybdopterin-guanine dinucleotide biosynthesis protein A
MITGIILSGGTSHRMGKDKALLSLEGLPLIQHVINVLEKVCDDILIIAQKNHDFHFLGKTVLHDIEPGFGALMGLYTGLKMAATSRVLAVGCDMPLIKAPVLLHLISCSHDVDVVVPRINGYFEPLLAVYSKGCLKHIEDMISRSEKCIYDFYPRVRVREVQESELKALDPELKSFINLNTPRQLDEIKKSQRDKGKEVRSRE